MAHPTHPADPTATGSASPQELVQHLRGYEGRLPEAVLWYRDRTRPEGHRLMRGSEIIELERRYFVTASGRLPYYKIERIEVAGDAVFKRPLRR